MRRAAAVFALFLALYLWTMPPGIAPYRDAGEMSVAARSLGVPHPPSYPLYALAGRAADALVPFASPAYRSGVLSAAAGAAALALLFWALGAGGPALSAAVLLGLNPTFWSVCIVQEMYSLTMAMACLLLALALRERERPLGRRRLALCLLFGLFLGNRTDLLLWAPGLLVLARPPRPRPRELALAAAFAALGLAVYLYLPLRSWRGPWLDWNHPASLSNLVGTLTRRGYGGTLDLLSKNYASGALFGANLKVYAAHLWDAFSAPGLALAAAGFWLGWRRDRRRTSGLALLYLAAGPLFLYMANMPPNPHALAIVEPHYLLSDLVLCVWAAGAAAACPPRAAWALAALAALTPWPGGRWARMDRRRDLSAHDWAGDVLRSAPPEAAVAAKKDVQVFSLWYLQRAAGARPDVRVAAQGLAHSPWYQASHRREASALRLGPLRAPEDWARFAAENPRAHATMDAEGLPSAKDFSGLLARLSGPPAAADPWPFLLRRGDYRYERRPEFFSADLVESYALSRQRLASKLAGEGALEPARRELSRAWAMKWLQPEAPALLGFIAYRQGRIDEALSAYALAASGYARMLELTREYRSLPAVADSLKAASADVWLNYGVAYEAAKRPADAERCYLRALELRPSAKAHYNLAVLHWGKDWARVLAELEQALRVDPGYADALRYLPAARAKAAGR